MREKVKEYCRDCQKPVELEYCWGNGSQEGMKFLWKGPCPECGGDNLVYYPKQDSLLKEQSK